MALGIDVRHTRACHIVSVHTCSHIESMQDLVVYAPQLLSCTFYGSTIGHVHALCTLHSSSLASNQPLALCAYKRIVYALTHIILRM